MSTKLLVLVTKGINEDYITSLLGDIQQSLSRLGLADVTLSDSGSWFRERFQQTGDWDSWVWETVNGIDYITRKPNFDGFVVTTDQLGKANAGIVSLALQNKRAVLAYDEDRPLRKVTELHVDDPTNWTEGWSYDAERIEV